jgi:hypothetical protein
MRLNGFADLQTRFKKNIPKRNKVIRFRHKKANVPFPVRYPSVTARNPAKRRRPPACYNCL